MLEGVTLFLFICLLSSKNYSFLNLRRNVRAIFSVLAREKGYINIKEWEVWMGKLIFAIS